MRRFAFVFVLLYPLALIASLVPKGTVLVGADVFFDKQLDQKMLSGKTVGLISNQTGIGKNLQTTLSRFIQSENPYTLKVLFTPEHGYFGDVHANEEVKNELFANLLVYNLQGYNKRRPTTDQLEGVDVLVYDIQDIGSRSYTYVSTLLYCMEEAAKHHIQVIVLDRPNPMGGLVVDGFMVDEKWRSFVGYLNVPYCHGMTIGELARFFNEEHNIGCHLVVIPMQGWKRGMSFEKTGLTWIPTSPQIPEASSVFFYPTTGLIGHLSLASIGVGYTLPFKLVGAPWMDADAFSAKLNGQNLPGVYFQPYYFRPFFGKFMQQQCRGVKIIITDPNTFLPVTTQYTLMGVIKTLHPNHYAEAINLARLSRQKIDLFHKLNGNEEVFETLLHEKYFIWKLRERAQKDRAAFIPIRKKYLIKEYA